LVRLSLSLPVVIPLLAALLAPASARGAALSFVFEGTVDTVTDTHGVLDGSVVPGTMLLGRMTYDLESPDIDPDVDEGIYLLPVPPNALEIDFGSYAIDVPVTFKLLVYDDVAFGPLDEFRWLTEGASFPFPGLPGVTLERLGFTLRDLSTTAFSSDALPSEVLDLDAFPDERSFLVTGCLDSEFDLVCSEVSLIIAGEVTPFPSRAAMRSCWPASWLWRSSRVAAAGRAHAGRRGRRSARPESKSTTGDILEHPDLGKDAADLDRGVAMARRGGCRSRCAPAATRRQSMYARPRWPAAPPRA
jgi:hypothetical protein